MAPLACYCHLKEQLEPSPESESATKLVVGASGKILHKISARGVFAKCLWYWILSGSPAEQGPAVTRPALSPAPRSWNPIKNFYWCLQPPRAPRRSPARLSRPQSVLSPGFFVARELNITNLVTVLSSPPHRENVFQKVSVGTPPPAQRVAAWCSVCRWRDEKQDQVIAASARGGGGGKGGKLNGIYFHCSRDQIFTLVG